MTAPAPVAGSVRTVPASAVEPINASAKTEAMGITRNVLSLGKAHPLSVRSVSVASAPLVFSL